MNTHRLLGVAAAIGLLAAPATATAGGSYDVIVDAGNATILDTHVEGGHGGGGGGHHHGDNTAEAAAATATTG